MNNMEFKEIYKSESYGQYGEFGIQVLLNKSDLTFEDLENEGQTKVRYAINDAIKLIESAVMEYKISLSKEDQEHSAKVKTDILNIFPLLVYVEEIPNGYCSKWCCKHRPWFIVTTLKGRIKIGWRKSVINIDWSDSVIKEDADKLFPTENVTKIERSIHAWSYEKAEEYIVKLLSI